MKKINKWIGILYIIISISILVLTFSGASKIFVILNRINLYMGAIACGIGALVGLANFLKKELACGLFCILGAVVYLGYILLNVPIVVIVEAGMMLFCGIMILVLKNNYDDAKANGSIIFFCILLFIFILSNTAYQSTLAIMNLISLKKSISTMANDDNLETYIYKATTNETVFLNIDGNEINRKLFDDFDYRNYDNGFKYNLLLTKENKTIGLSDAIIKDKTHFINSKGDTMFSIYNGFTKNAGELFVKYVLDNNIFGISQGQEDLHKNIYATFFEKITDENKSNYDDNCDFSAYEKNINDGEEYTYFRNNELVIQVVNTIDLSEDNVVKEAYSAFNKNNAQYYDRNSEKIDEFYRTKKHYKFINLDEERTVELKCNNMIYEALNDGTERLLAYRNRYIPFYDTDKVGFVTPWGRVMELSNDYVIRSVNEKYMLIYEKSAEKNHVFSTETMNELKDMSRLLYTYDSIALSYSLSDIQGIQLLDQNYEYVDTFYNTPNLIGHHVIGYSGGNSYKNQFYFYNDGVIFKIEDIANQIISVNSMHYKATGNHIFESIGIID